MKYSKDESSTLVQETEQFEEASTCQRYEEHFQRVSKDAAYFNRQIA